MRKLAAILAVVLALGAPASSFAQDQQLQIPFPMPRPADRMPGATTVIDDPLETPPAEAAALVDPGVPTAPTDPVNAAVQAVEAVVKQLQPVRLTAQITEDGATIPDGLVWRVFDTKTDTTGELALAAKSDSATATFQLAPGEYVVHVAYGRAQASDTLTVAAGDNNKAIILDAGALRLNAAVSGDVPIPLNLLRFDIMTSGGENDREMVAEGASANDIITLNAGTYHVVSYFGDVNAVVRADLRVEPGQITDATLYHKAEQVSFKLVSQTGGEAIADVEWTVKNEAGESVYSYVGTFPATVLAEGDYVVLAKQGSDVYNREFQVLPGPSRDIEVLTTVY